MSMFSGTELTIDMVTSASIHLKLEMVWSIINIEFEKNSQSSYPILLVYPF